jgi:hypothetical protein
MKTYRFSLEQILSCFKFSRSFADERCGLKIVSKKNEQKRNPEIYEIFVLREIEPEKLSSS